CSPEYMSSYARRFILHNVRLVGGCCGTTPEHIRQIKMAVRALAPAVVRASETLRAGAAPSPPLSRVEGAPVPRDQKSRLARSIANRRFVIGDELLPPRGEQTDRVVARARRRKFGGVGVIGVHG